MYIYQSKFLEVNYLELQYLLHLRWTNVAGFMDKEAVYHEYINFLNKRIYKRANQIYIDYRKIEHLINQENVDWLVTYILPKIISHKGYRLGVLLSKSIQLPEKIEINNIEINAKIFQKPEKLMHWLMEGAERKEPGADDHEHSHDGDSCQHH